MRVCVGCVCVCVCLFFSPYDALFKGAPGIKCLDQRVVAVHRHVEDVEVLDHGRLPVLALEHVAVALVRASKHTAPSHRQEGHDTQHMCVWVGVGVGVRTAHTLGAHRPAHRRVVVVDSQADVLLAATAVGLMH